MNGRCTQRRSGGKRERATEAAGVVEEVERDVDLVRGQREDADAFGLDRVGLAAAGDLALFFAERGGGIGSGGFHRATRITRGVGQRRGHAPESLSNLCHSGRFRRISSQIDPNALIFSNSLVCRFAPDFF